MAGYDDLKISAEVNGLFETTIVYSQFRDADSLCADLKAAIAKRRASHDNLPRSNVGGWHSDTDMQDWGGEAARYIAGKAIAMVKRITTVSNAKDVELDWSLHMWANVLPKGAFNRMHIHPGILWAAVFYVDAGDTGQDAGGELVLEDPRFPMTHMRLNALRVIASDGKPQTGEQRLRPKTGDMVIFPAWLRHSVEPYLGERERISIAMNIDGRPK